MQLSFPAEQENLRSLDPVQVHPTKERAICNILRLMTGTQDPQDLSKPLPDLL
jgi:hypothetical protein